jgi:adenosine deaminase
LFKDIYAKAKASGIRRTAHAGEEADVSYMQEALESLDIQRADHGIKLVQDPRLMEEFAKLKIMVTMCPLSNVRLRCVKELKDLPIQTYLDHGVIFSINSDDPAYFGGYILANYVAVQEAFNLHAKDWERIARTSIEASWCRQDRKNEMLRLLAKCMEV